MTSKDKGKGGQASMDLAPTAPPGIDLGMLDDIVGYWLRRAQVTVYQDYARTVGAMDIRPSQFAALTIIGANPGLSQTTLAMTMGIDRSGAVILIDALEGKGLATRSPSPVDRRTYAIFLTEQGKVTLGKLKDLVMEHDRRITASLTAEERSQLNSMLLRICRG